MKRKAKADRSLMETGTNQGPELSDSEHPLLPSLDSSSSGDVCEALMSRYAKSSAAQHRHLCASAAAIRSILLDSGLPLSPPSYLTAAVSALRSSGPDPSAAAAIASFLSILLPVLPPSSLPPAKAKDSAFVLAGFLTELGKEGIPTGTVRSVVRALGFLVLYLDKEDWESVQFPLETLLVFSVDRRPKVRKSGQDCVEKIFNFLRDSPILKKASKLVIQMQEKYIPLANRLMGSNNTKNSINPEETEVIHFLNLLKLIASSLYKKVRVGIFSQAYKLLIPQCYILTRNILNLLEALLNHLEIKQLESELESFVLSITLYLSPERKNPIDTIVNALELMNVFFNKIKYIKPNLWTSVLPPIFEAISGYLVSDVDSSKDVAHQLKQLLTFVDWRVQLDHKMESTVEGTAIRSICLSLDKVLSISKSPTDNVLAVISVLFLRLGECSYFFMKDILLKLSKLVTNSDKKKAIFNHVEECIGSAVVSMGADKILSLIPIEFQEEKLTCSNSWLIPILNKYTVGSSLQFFTEQIVPLAKSLDNSCRKVKKGHKQKKLQPCVTDLWGLLPAFCRYPNDMARSFKQLSKLLLESLYEDPSLHEIIAKSLQELVNENKNVVNRNQQVNIFAEIFTSLSLEVQDSCFKNFCYNNKIASKNLKVLSSYSLDFISIYANIFFDSSKGKSDYIKETLRCMASVAGTAKIRSFFLSLVERFNLANSSTESENIDKSEIHENNVDKDEKGKEPILTEKENERRCSVSELISVFAESADQDLSSIFFDFIRSSLLIGDESCHAEAFFALSTILKENNEFALAQVNELLLLLHHVKSASDNTILKNRLSCYQYLLVHMLKANDEDMNEKIFLILNEIILALKSKKESRKLAYDVLLATSCSLKNPISTDTRSDLQRLFRMVMGYLSSPSPHITSGAISALSLLIFNDADFCLGVPNLIPNVLVLLQSKSNEIIKAALGFVKVLVSSLQSDKLVKLQADILTGILPWSNVSKFHFRSKVGIILEILIRKCGFASVDVAVPEKYKGFVKKIAEARQSKKNPKESEEAMESIDSPTKSSRKRDSDLRSDGPEKKKRFRERSDGQKGRTEKQKEKNSIVNRGGEKSKFRFRTGSVEQGKNTRKFVGTKRKKDDKRIEMRRDKYNNNKGNRIRAGKKDDAFSKSKKRRIAELT